MSMIIKGLILISSLAFAQGPEYTGTIQQKPSPSEKRVNDEIIKTNKKMELESKRKEIELKKEAPKSLRAQPPVKVRPPFVVHPKQDSPNDTRAYPDQYDHSVGKDPSTEFEQGVIENRNHPTQEMQNAEYIRQFKANAEKAGVKVEIDPKTLRARPVGGSSGTGHP